MKQKTQTLTTQLKNVPVIMADWDWEEVWMDSWDILDED